MEVIIQLSQDEYWEILWVVVEILKFQMKCLSFKGVNPRNEWRNLKKFKISKFQYMMKGGIYTTFTGWTLWKNLNGGENFQNLDEILEF